MLTSHLVSSSSSYINILKMPSGYVCLYKRSPRSFLFYVVANVGPGGSTRPLAVAYRQGHDISRSPLSRVEHLVNETLFLVKALSEPVNSDAIVEERELAKKWYRDHEDAHKRQPRPAALPDTPQPPFKGWKDKWEPILQPELPYKGVPREFPAIAVCTLSSLIQANESTRIVDVQLELLSTPFYGNCLEYGAVVVDISNLQNVKYGIVAFPVCYMADVVYHSQYGGWDPVEDDPPQKEPDIVLVNERPRVFLSILDYLRKYFPFMEDDPKVLELQAYPCVDDPGVMDCESL